MILQFLLTVIICSDPVRNRRSGSFRRPSDLPAVWLESRGEEAVVLAAKAIRGVALGIVVTAVIQSGLGGIGLVVTGVPAAPVLDRR